MPCGVVTRQVGLYGVLMTQSGPDPDERPWPAEMTRATGKQVKRFRTDKWRTNRLSADALAAAVTELGLPYTRAPGHEPRGRTADVDHHRRGSGDRRRARGSRCCLRSPSIPSGPPSTCQAGPPTPGLRRSGSWATRRCPTGRRPTQCPPLSADGHSGSRGTQPVELYRDHDRYLKEWRRWSSPEGQERDNDRADTAEAFLSRTRDYMRELGILLPDLPAELAHIDRDVWT